MQDASGIDLTQFKLWYAQAGTPMVSFKDTYDAEQNSYTIHLTQNTPATPNQTDKKPMVIPIALGLLDSNGSDLIGTKVLTLSDAEQSFTFEDITEKPVPSVLRNFSAPVILQTNLTNQDYTFLSKHDTDGFNRWEASQTLDRKMLCLLYTSPSPRD